MHYNGGFVIQCLAHTESGALMSRIRNCELPKPDPQGRIRPYVGRDEKGKAIKFQVGNVNDTTHHEMQQRLDNIRLLYPFEEQPQSV